MGQHRAPEPAPDGPDLAAEALKAVRRYLRRLVALQAVVNFLVAAALVSGPAGSSPALAFLRVTGLPLGVWAMAFGTVAVLLALKQYVPAHTLASVLWPFLAVGAVIGILTGSTTSPAASLVFTALVLGMAGLHVSALVFRRGEQRAGRL